MKNTGLAVLGILIGISIDTYGIVCQGISQMSPYLGETMSLMGDGVGIILFMAWTIAMGGGLNSLKKIKNKGAIQKFIATSIGELIPVVGALPLWTIFAISMSIKNKDPKKNIIIEDKEADTEEAEDIEEEDDDENEDSEEEDENEDSENEETKEGEEEKEKELENF